MRKHLFLSLMSLMLLVGCDKNKTISQDVSEKAPSTSPIKDSADAYDDADQAMTDLSDKIDAQTTSAVERKTLICEAYAETYKKQLMPALSKLSPEQYNEKSLLSDLDFQLKDLESEYQVSCTQ